MNFKAAVLTLFSVVCIATLSLAQSLTYQVDVEKSKLDWEGHRFFGGMHTGNINLYTGKLSVLDGKLNAGVFQIDMNSIEVTDISGEPAERLTAHLKTDDFFDVEKFPYANFRLKHIDYADDKRAAIVGEISIRGITQQISFPAEITIEGDQLHAVARGIRVDRTVHDSQYGSINFFRDLGRKIVHNEFVLNVELFATKE